MDSVSIDLIRTLSAIFTFYLAVNCLVNVVFFFFFLEDKVKKLEHFVKIMYNTLTVVLLNYIPNIAYLNDNSHDMFSSIMMFLIAGIPLSVGLILIKYKKEINENK